MTEVDVGWLSLIPPLLAILLAILTRQVVLSLLVGIWSGWIIANQGQFLLGTADTLNVLIRVFANPDQARVIFFTLLMGAFLILISRAGGIQGFIDWTQRIALAQTRRSAQLFSWLIGLGVFIESTITCLVVGTVSRPLFDRLNISREKLAYICDSTSAPVCILIPFNGWGATVLGLLATQVAAGNLSGKSALTVFLIAVPLNFYAIIAVLLVFIVCWSGKDIGPMRVAEERARTTGQVMREDSTAMIEENAIHMPPKAGFQPRARTMLIPLLAMVMMVMAGIVITGMLGMASDSVHAFTVMNIIDHASGSTAVLWGVCLGLLFIIMMMLWHRHFTINECIDLAFKGAGGMLPMATLMLLAFAIGMTCEQLNTGPWLAQWIAPHIAPLWLAPLVFLVSCAIAFSTGSSWGTFAIMIPLAIPLASAMSLADSQLMLPLVVSAVLGGGVFGDHCSPISDTTVLSSMASCCDHIDHVRTQLPYALIAAALALLFYIGISLQF